MGMPQVGAECIWAGQEVTMCLHMTLSRNTVPVSQISFVSHFIPYGAGT